MSARVQRQRLCADLVGDVQASVLSQQGGLNALSPCRSSSFVPALVIVSVFRALTTGGLNAW